jgi:hypothetical protein
MPFSLRSLIACLSLVSLARVTFAAVPDKLEELKVSRREALLSALPESVVGRLSDVVKGLDDNQVSAFHTACCSTSGCNGDAITFLLNHCNKLAPEGTFEEDGDKGKWAACARDGDIWFFTYIQKNFPELPKELAHPSYERDKSDVLSALGEWHKSVNYSPTNPDLDKALLLFLFDHPDPRMEREDIKIRSLCYLGGADLKDCLNYWMGQSDRIVRNVFRNAMRGGGNTLPIVQPNLFSKLSCIESRNCTRQDYVDACKEVKGEPLAKYLKEANVKRLLDIMKGSIKDNWDEFDHQLPTLDPEYVDQLIASSPGWIQRVEPKIREMTRNKSLTDIDKTINDEMDRVRNSKFLTEWDAGPGLFFTKAFTSLRFDLIEALNNVLQHCPEYLKYFYDAVSGDLITDQELEQLVTEPQDIKDRTAAKSQISQLITNIVQHKLPEHLLFDARFSEALKIVQNHLYKVSYGNQGKNIDSVIMEIDAQTEDQPAALRKLQTAMIASKILKSASDGVQGRFENEPDLGEYKHWEMRVLWDNPNLGPIAYHREMRPQEFMKQGDEKAPGLAEVLLHLYDRYQKETFLREILNGIVAKGHPRFVEGAKAIWLLGDKFDFSANPEESWREFEVAFYKLDCEKGGRFKKVRDSGLGVGLSEKGIDPELYSNYSDLSDAMIEATMRD